MGPRPAAAEGVARQRCAVTGGSDILPSRTSGTRPAAAPGDQTINPVGAGAPPFPGPFHCTFLPGSLPSGRARARSVFRRPRITPLRSCARIPCTREKHWNAITHEKELPTAGAGLRRIPAAVRAGRRGCAPALIGGTVAAAGNRRRGLRPAPDRGARRGHGHPRGAVGSAGRALGVRRAAAGTGAAGGGNRPLGAIGDRARPADHQ